MHFHCTLLLHSSKKRDCFSCHVLGERNLIESAAHVAGQHLLPSYGWAGESLKHMGRPIGKAFFCWVPAVLCCVPSCPCSPSAHQLGAVVPSLPVPQTFPLRPEQVLLWLFVHPRWGKMGFRVKPLMCPLQGGAGVTGGSRGWHRHFPAPAPHSAQ